MKKKRRSQTLGNKKGLEDLKYSTPTLDLYLISKMYKLNCNKQKCGDDVNSSTMQAKYLGSKDPNP